MTEIERLTELGTRYLSAARGVILTDRSQRGELYLDMPTSDMMIQLAQVIATADRQIEQTQNRGTRLFETHWMEWPSNLFERRWKHEGVFSEILGKGDDAPELAALGDLLHLQECHDHGTTDRVIIYQITELRQGENGDLHIEADFVARKGGVAL